MTPLKKIKQDKTKTTDRVTLGLSEKVTREHNFFDRIPCNLNYAFYPRQPYSICFMIFQSLSGQITAYFE